MLELSTPSLVEAHSYAGGLRYTPFSPAGRRPDWVPPPDSVGWRDEFDLEPSDTVIEFSQRKFAGEKVTWLGVYKRSIDARFGDRKNHAGIGVWLLRARIADARALLISLHQFAAALAANPEPELLATEVADFASGRFLESYLVPSGSLPPEWAGAPGTDSALPDTSLFGIVATSFDSALDRIAEAVTRWSLAWDNSQMSPRALVRVTDNPAALSGGDFGQLPLSGTFLADVIERIPQSFAEARDVVRAAEEKGIADKARLENEIQSIKDEWSEERRQIELLDGLPATMEGIASRLNLISRQYVDLSDRIATLSPSRRRETIQITSQEPPAYRGGQIKTTQAPPAHFSPRRQDEEEFGGSYFLPILLVTMVGAIVALLVYYFS